MNGTVRGPMIGVLLMRMILLRAVALKPRRYFNCISMSSMSP